MRRAWSLAVGLGRLAAAAQRRSTTFSRDYQLYKEKGMPDLDRRAAGVLAEVAAVLCRGAGHRSRYRIDPRTVRAGRDRPDRRRRRGRQQSAQPDPERRGAVGHGRSRRAVCDVALASAAVPRRRSVAWIGLTGRRTEYLYLAVQFAYVRFPRRLDVRVGRRCRRRDGAEERRRKRRPQDPGVPARS